MSATDLRKNFHILIDSIDNDNLLLKLYEFIQRRVTAKDGTLWSRLTIEEQEELIHTVEECENPDYLINHKEMKKKHRQWL